jgi:hypothetical protein
MANDLAEFENIISNDNEKVSIETYQKTISSNLYITATFGGNVQFTIESNYCVLNEKQINILIEILSKRYKDEKYSSTNPSDVELYIDKNGNIKE